MQIGEFLVKLGVVADTEKVDKFGKSLAKVGAISAVAVSALNTAAGAAFAFLDGQIRKAEELAKTKNGLIEITKSEVAISKQYQESTKRLSGTFDLLKAKIALGVAPQMLAITERMNAFLMSNKKLITDGLKKVVGWLFEFAEGTVNIFRSLGDLIDRTVGWKGALLVLVGVLALVKKASIATFVTNPITWVIAAIAGLILLVDDLMTYMRGGKSLLGKYWDPFIVAIRAVKKWWRGLTDDSKYFFKVLMSGIGALIFIMMSNPILAIITAIAAGAYLIIKNWGRLPEFFSEMWDGILEFFSIGTKGILEFFGMSEQSAEKTVKALGQIFSLMSDLIKKPFKSAFDWVSAQFSWLIDTIDAGVEKLKFWEDSNNGFSASASMIGSSIPSAGNATRTQPSNIINGGDQKIDIHVSDKEAAKVISNEIQRGGNKMAQANAQLAGGF